MIRFSIPELSVMIGKKNWIKTTTDEMSNAEQSLDACVCLFLSLDVFGAVKHILKNSLVFQIHGREPWSFHIWLRLSGHPNCWKFYDKWIATLCLEP